MNSGCSNELVTYAVLSWPNFEIWKGSSSMKIIKEETQLEAKNSIDNAGMDVLVVTVLAHHNTLVRPRPYRTWKDEVRKAWKE